MPALGATSDPLRPSGDSPGVRYRVRVLAAKDGYPLREGEVYEVTASSPSDAIARLVPDPYGDGIASLGRCRVERVPGPPESPEAPQNASDPASAALEVDYLAEGAD